MSLYLKEQLFHIYPPNSENILVIDNSSLGVWEECNRKYLFRVVLSLRDPLEKPAITFGSAFHAFLECWHIGMTFQEAFEAFVKETQKEISQITVSKDEAGAKTGTPEYSLEFGYILCKKYAENHPIENEYFQVKRDDAGKPYAEMGFAINLPNGIVIGRIDLIGVITAKEKDEVIEHKSTKYVLNPSYFSDFNPNNQVSTYLFAASELLGKKIDTALINVIRVKDYKRGDPEENKEKLFGRIETTRSVEQQEMRMRHANHQLGQIQESIEVGLDGFPMHTQSCRTRFGECEYRRLCMASNEKLLQVLCETTFDKRKWEPYRVFEDVNKVVEIKDTLEEKHKVDVKDVKEFIV